MDIKISIQLFSTGLAFGLWPCLFSCSAVLLPYVSSIKNSFKAGIILGVFFSLGRITAYTILGMIAGYSGKLFSSIFMIGNYVIYFKILSAIIMLFLGISLLFTKNNSTGFCRFLLRHDIKSFFLLGFFIGIAPCAPLISVLFYIMLKSTSILQGFFYGLCFGAGTFFSPIILLSAISGIIPSSIFNSNPSLVIYSKYFRVMCSAAIVFLAMRILLS